MVSNRKLLKPSLKKNGSYEVKYFTLFQFIYILLRILTLPFDNGLSVFEFLLYLCCFALYTKILIFLIRLEIVSVVNFETVLIFCIDSGKQTECDRRGQNGLFCQRLSWPRNDEQFQSHAFYKPMSGHVY